MDYTFGEGKISYYGSDDKYELNGLRTGLKIGGFSNITGSDVTGPSIKLFLNDTLFRSGGITDASPELFAIIEDKNGINISGTGIGHDLICWLDNNRDNSFILNSYFDYVTGSFTKGTIRFRFSEIGPGDHTLSVKAWDNYNNSSERSVSFHVNNRPEFILSNLMNYPNPFAAGTLITAEHNRPDDFLDIRIEIFNSSGSLVRILEESAFSTGYRIYPLEWDGLTEGGSRAGRGLYPYRMTVKTLKGETRTISGRMIIY